MCEQYSDKQIVKLPIPKMNKCSGEGFVFMEPSWVNYHKHTSLSNSEVHIK